MVEDRRTATDNIPPEVWGDYVEQFRGLNHNVLSARWQQGALLEEIYTDFGQIAIARLAREEAVEEDYLTGLRKFSTLLQKEDLRQELSLGHHLEIVVHYNPDLEGGRTPIEWLDFASETKPKLEQLRGFLDWYYDTRGEVYNDFWGLYYGGQLDSALREHGGKFFLMGHEVHPKLIAQWLEEIKEREGQAEEREEERKATIKRRGVPPEEEEEKKPVTYIITATWEVEAVNQDDAYSKLKEKLGKRTSALLRTAKNIHFVRRERQK